MFFFATKGWELTNTKTVNVLFAIDISHYNCQLTNNIHMTVHILKQLKKIYKTHNLPNLEHSYICKLLFKLNLKKTRVT